MVTKLFNLMKPHRSYFGQKDYQQTVVVRSLAADLSFDLTVVVLPTVREPDGLAMSSRNARLTPDQRRAAPVLYRSLRHAEKRVRGGEQRAKVILDEMRAMIEGEPVACVDYVALCHPETLRPLDAVDGPTLAAVAVKFGHTRLIDNILITAS